MKAAVSEKPCSVAVTDVDDPRIEHPNDVIVHVTSSAICASDLHMYEGRTAARPGIVFGVPTSPAAPSRARGLA